MMKEKHIILIYKYEKSRCISRHTCFNTLFKNSMNQKFKDDYLNYQMGQK